MTRYYQQNRGPGAGTVIGIVGAVAMAGLAATLYYLKSGVGEADAVLIPKALEDRIDRVVAALNQRFGKQWVDRRLEELQSTIAAMLPAPLVGLVDVVYQVERVGRAYRLNGQQKLCRAIGMCN